MHQGQRFGQIDVECKRACNGAGDLRYFDWMGEPVAEVIGIAASEDLSFVFKAAKGAGVDDAVAVALEVVAVGMRRFREAAPAGLLHLHLVAGQHLEILTCQSLVPSSWYLVKTLRATSELLCWVLGTRHSLY